MSFSLLLSFLLLSVPTFFTPGPNNLMLMTSAAKFGARRTMPHMFGILLGFPFMVFVVGMGLGEIFSAYPVIKTVMKYLAIGYFLWMAWHLLGLKIGSASGSERPLRLVEAALFQWINPKAWAMAISFVAAFVVVGEHRFTSVALLALACLLLGPFSSLTWIVFGQQLQSLLYRTGTERYLGIVLALLMVSAIVLFLL
jgi:threonine/homoserine/homoserine lactone efflux protein